MRGNKETIYVAAINTDELASAYPDGLSVRDAISACLYKSGWIPDKATNGNREVVAYKGSPEFIEMLRKKITKGLIEVSASEAEEIETIAEAIETITEGVEITLEEARVTKLSEATVSDTPKGGNEAIAA